MGLWDTAFDFVQENSEEIKDTLFDSGREAMEEQGPVSGGTSGSGEPFSPTAEDSVNSAPAMSGQDGPSQDGSLVEPVSDTASGNFFGSTNGKLAGIAALLALYLLYKRTK